MRAWLLLGLVACSPKLPTALDPLYADAVESSVRGDAERASVAAWRTFTQLELDDPRRDRTRRLLSDNFRALGLDYAAARIDLDQAVERRTLALVEEALRGVLRGIDEGLLDPDRALTGFLAAESLEFVSDDVRDGIHLAAGTELLRQGEVRHAHARFASLRSDGAARSKADYLLALHNVLDGDVEGAQETIRGLRDATDDPELGRELDLALARLHFELGEYDDAWTRYDALRSGEAPSADLLLEMAWTAWHLDRPGDVLGLVIALSAPSHRHRLLPERFTLRALVGRRLCQPAAVASARADFDAQLAPVLADVREGAAPWTVPALRTAALDRGRALAHAHRSDQLNTERAQLKTLFGDELRAEVDGWYEMALELGSPRLERAVAAESELLLGELLAAEQGVQMLAHEQAVTQLRGRRRPSGLSELPAPPKRTADLAFFSFDGEYWTDELDDLVVRVEDRCVE